MSDDPSVQPASPSERMPSTRWRRVGGTILGVVVMGVLVVVLARQIQWEEVSWQRWLQSFGYDTVLVTGVILAVATALMLWIWGSMLAAVDPAGQSVSWRRHFGIYLSTALGKRLPGALWHVASRTVLYNRAGIRKRVVLAVSGMEVLFMTASGALLALLFLPSILPLLRDNRLLLLGLAALLVFSLISLHPRVLHRLSLGRELKRHTIPARLQFQWRVACGAIWLLGGALVAYIASQLAPVQPDVIPYLVASWIIAALIGTVTLILPAGFGIADLSLAYFLSFAIPAAEAAFVAVAVRLLAKLWDVLMPLLSGAIALFSGRDNPSG